MDAITLKEFDGLKKRDFDNGAVIEAIRVALKERECSISTPKTFRCDNALCPSQVEGKCEAEGLYSACTKRI